MIQICLRYFPLALFVLLVLGFAWRLPAREQARLKALVPADTPADWTWRDSVPGPKGPIAFRVWVAERNQALRGLIIAPKIKDETAFFADTAVRAAATSQRLGLLFIDNGTFGIFDTTQGHDTLFLNLLAKAASASGHPELEHCPWMPFGHSTAGHFCKNLAYWKPERVFGILYYKSGNIAPPAWAPPGHTLKEIPWVTINGQFEIYGPNGPLKPGESQETQWWAVRDTLMKLRASGHRISMIVEPGGGHTGFSRMVGDYLSLFIRKCAQARIPAGAIADRAPVALNALPESSGWLSDTCIESLIRRQPLDTAHLIQPYADFPADRKAVSFWHLDGDMAKAWVAFHRLEPLPARLRKPRGGDRKPEAAGRRDGLGRKAGPGSGAAFAPPG